MYRINEIKLNLGEQATAIPARILERLGLSKDQYQIAEWKIAKESLDARDKGDIKFVYAVDFRIEPDLPKAYKQVSPSPHMAYSHVEQGSEPLKNRPLVVGFGPSGMFSALILAELGYKPLVLERGQAVQQRVADVQEFWDKGILKEDSNVQFGEGGAGTFSDGKLTTGTKDIRIRKVLEELVEAGASEDILYKQKPHVGTDVLRQVVVNIREKIIKLGGEIRFATKLTDIEFQEGSLTACMTERRNADGAVETERIETEHLILAIGHSARDTVRMLHQRGMEMEQKPFSIGVRIQHPQALINTAQYGPSAGKGLPPADYKLAHHCKNGRGVYTFCMCPGGQVIVASSQQGGVVTNGMSNSSRDGEFANSGLLVDVRTSDYPSEHPLAGLEFQETYERLAFEQGGGTYKAPVTTWGDFLEGSKGALPVIQALPQFAVEAIREAMPQLGKKLRGFDKKDATLTAVESRSSSPVRILRSERRMTSISGIYPVGEGAGYAGGIVSAAVDGIKTAEQIAILFSNKF